MHKSSLYVWKNSNDCPKTETIAHDYTLQLFIILFCVFVLYGAFSTFLFNFLEAEIEATIESKQILWLNELLTDVESTDDYVNVAMELIDLLADILLFLIVRLIGFVILHTSKWWNGNNHVFTLAQLDQIVNRTLFITALFFIVFAIYEKTSIDLYMATAFTTFLVGGFISIGNFKSSTNKKQKERKKQPNITDQTITYATIICLISIPFTVLFDYFSNIESQGFLCSVFALCILLLFISYVLGIDRRNIKRLTVQRLYGNNVLIYGQIAYSTLLQNSIYRSVKSKYDNHKPISRAYKQRKFNTIILVNPLDSESKKAFLQNELTSLLASDGVIIAPAYTSNRKGSILLTPKEYKTKLREMGFDINFIYHTNTITYVELINPHENET